jgi:hypothetical protein
MSIGRHSIAWPWSSRSAVMIVSVPLAENGRSYCEIWYPFGKSG